jgi:hypothetical protein
MLAESKYEVTEKWKANKSEKRGRGEVARGGENWFSGGGTAVKFQGYYLLETPL